MKRFIIFSMCMVLLTSDLNAFADNSEVSDWAKSDVEEVIELGFIPEDLQRDYQAYITREEMAAIAVEYLAYFYNVERNDMIDLYCYVYEKEVPVDSFTDLSEARYADQIYQATAMGLVQGRGNGIFDPYAPITREEAACIFSDVYLSYRTGWKLGQSEVENLKDVGEISRWALYSVRVMYWSRIMHGVSANAFAPKDLLTREQCFVAFSRMNKISVAGVSGLASVERMVAEIEGRPNYESKYTLENDHYKILYGMQESDVEEEWSFWIVYKDGYNGGGRRNIIAQFNETQLQDFAFDETGTSLYCTAGGGCKYKIELENAAVKVVE